jgi:hypothetical protein
VVEIAEGINYKLNVSEYLPLVEKWDRGNFDIPFDHGYAQAKTDLIKALTPEVTTLEEVEGADKLRQKLREILEEYNLNLE